MDPLSGTTPATTPHPVTPGLPAVHRFRCHLEALESLALPAYPGSALRGLIGFGLRRTVCVTGQKQCPGCPLTGSCAYFRFFEDSRPEGETGRDGQAGPHPYVLDLGPEPAPRLAPGERYRFGLTLLGGAHQLVPYLVVGINRAGQRGLGPRNARFVLARLEQEQTLGREDWVPVGGQGTASLDLGETRAALPEALAGTVTVRVQTPLRLKRHGHLVGPREFSPGLFMEALRLRLTDLARAYGDPEAGPGGLPPENPPAEAFGPPKVTWKEWTRFSTRQQTRMQMGGLVGGFSADLDALGPWAPFLWFGQWLHLGKATAMGLGRYRLGPAASL